MEDIVGCVVIVGTVVVLFLIRWAVIFYGWNLVLVPIAHLPNITWVQAILVSFILGLFFGSVSFKKAD